MTRAEKFNEVFGLKMDVENFDCGFFDCSDIESCASCPVSYTQLWWYGEYEAPSQPQKRDEITKSMDYKQGFFDGYKQATEQANACIDNIKEEILEETECHYGNKCLSANCPSNTDCMIMGEHAIEIIDRHTNRKEHK